nr:hypothetical protein [Tanacetum cinerariifolium]
TVEDGEGGEGSASSGTVATNEASKVSMPKRVSKTPSIATLSKLGEGKKQRREGVKISMQRNPLLQRACQKKETWVVLDESK